ncbi:response regulator [Cohnella fermenti]|uniref:Response regulator n=1 Tax=Cohnella fermenti TaxID=2565925 RepID=A0A4S4C398_9BACL|nr:response regulator [Cohnella fermenti]THF82120.1 response regulator [Cohnella fermenti]
MKALIVDDEQHVRTSIRLLADWSALGIDEVLEAEDGKSALEHVRDHAPDIIVTDIMMPLLNGIELMERVQAQSPRRHKIIVVSGYNDFEWIRHAMRHGGIDYLLKPLDQRQLQEALARAVEYCRADRLADADGRLALEMNELKQLYRDKALSELLVKAGVPVLREQLARAMPDLAHAATGRLAVVRFAAWEHWASPPDGTDPDALASRWLTRLEGLLPAGAVAFRNWGSSMPEIAILVWREGCDMEFLRDALRRYDGPASADGVHIGIGAKTEFPASLHRSYREAVQALARRNLLNARCRFHEIGEAVAEPLRRLSFDRFEENFLTSVQSGKREPVRQAVSEWSAYLREFDELGLQQLQQWLEEYRMVKERWLDSFYDERPGGDLRLLSTALRLHLNPTGELTLTALEGALEMDLLALQEAFIQSRQSRQVNVMQEIARFLQENYWKDIPLKEISERYFLNKEHISRRFKQEFGESITDYTNRLRIDRSKLLLLNPALRIAEIAEMIGYRDEKYFSRVFKKFEKVPPNLYRGAANTQYER